MARRKFIITGYLEYNPEDYTDASVIDVMLEEAAGQFHDQVLPGGMQYGLEDVHVDYEKTPS